MCHVRGFAQLLTAHKLAAPKWCWIDSSISRANQWKATDRRVAPRGCLRIERGMCAFMGGSCTAIQHVKPGSFPFELFSSCF
jgi:hypothetical protein